MFSDRTAKIITDFFLFVIFSLFLSSVTKNWVISVIVVLLMWLGCYVPRQIESIRLNSIAKRFGLHFKKNYFLYFPENEKFNVISGEINLRNIEISYLCKYESWGESSPPDIFYRQTTLTLDGEVETKEYFMSSKNISRYLSNIK